MLSAAQASQLSQVKTHLEQNKLRQEQIRKSLYFKCTMGVALFAATIGCGYACFKSNTQTSSQPTVRTAPVQQHDYSGTVKLLGLGGSVVGLAKSCGSLWQDFSSFWSIKEDIKVGLQQQEEMLIEQKVTQVILQQIQEQLVTLHTTSESSAEERYKKLTKWIKVCLAKQEKLARAADVQSCSEQIAALKKEIEQLVALLHAYIGVNQPGTLVETKQ